MKLVVGLGNPGSEYAHTRHNVGFMVVEELVGRCGGRWRRSVRWPARVAQIRLGDYRVCLVEPQTFMNASGDAVGPIARYHRVPPDHLLVIYDDADLPVGTLRLRPAGSAGGHRGMRSVIDALGTDRFPRLRVGIGRTGSNLVDHVLAPFSEAEADVMRIVIGRAADAVRCWIEEGLDSAMNRYNRVAKDPGSGA